MSDFIHPGNSVWFHNHAEGDPCDPNCYEQKHPDDLARKMRHFVRIDGQLHEVCPITRFSGVQPYVMVTFPNQGNRVDVIDLHDILSSY